MSPSFMQASLARLAMMPSAVICSLLNLAGLV